MENLSPLCFMKKLGMSPCIVSLDTIFEIPLADIEQMVKYSVDGRNEPHYRFFIPSKTTNFNTISYSCNGFSLNVDTDQV